MTEYDSRSIQICRVLCIFFLAYVHVNPGNEQWENIAPLYLYQISRILSETLGHASVPALSVLSGFLAVYAYQRRAKWWIYAKERFLTLMIPMLVWNILIFALSVVIFYVLKSQTSILHSIFAASELTPLLLANKLFSVLQYESMTVAFNFLRDAFVCSLLLPLLVFILRRFGVISILVIWIVGMTYGFWPIVLRPLILMFFVAGVYLALHSNRLVPSLNTLFKLFCAIFIALLLVNYVPTLSAHTGRSSLSTDVSGAIFRIIVTSSFLAASVLLSKTEIGKQIARLEPLAYPMFLAHTIIYLILWGVWQNVFGKDLDWPYVVFYVLAPFAALVGTYIICRGLEKLPVRIQKIMLGKSVKQRT